MLVLVFVVVFVVVVVVVVVVEVLPFVIPGMGIGEWGKEGGRKGNFQTEGVGDGVSLDVSGCVWLCVCVCVQIGFADLALFLVVCSVAYRAACCLLPTNFHSLPLGPATSFCQGPCTAIPTTPRTLLTCDIFLSMMSPRAFSEMLYTPHTSVTRFLVSYFTTSLVPWRSGIFVGSKL